MADNMYGYTDYRGPARRRRRLRDANVDETGGNRKPSDDFDDDDDDDDDPLRSGLWMEGDSLAPPCGASLGIVDAMLDLANIGPDDVLYDLGCGDGRVCLEAYWNFGVRGCVGVEIEEDLVARFRELAAELPEEVRPLPGGRDEGGGGDEDGGEDGGDDGDDRRAVKGEDQRSGTAVALGRARAVRPVRADLRDVLSALVSMYATDVGGRAEGSGGCGGGGNDDNTAAKLGDSDLSDLPRPTVIALYLLPDAIALIEPDLVRLMRSDPRLRVICNTWGLKGAGEPAAAEEVQDDSGGGSTLLRLYTGEGLPLLPPP